MVHIKNLRVRPKKGQPAGACAVELTEMLSCWATTNDLHSTGSCQQAAENLFRCMRTAPAPKKQHKPTINYHLARLGRRLR